MQIALLFWFHCTVIPGVQKVSSAHFCKELLDSTSCKHTSNRIRKQLAVAMMHQTCQSGWEKCEKFKTVILKSYLHWYLHSICTWIFDTNFSKHLNVDTEAHATTPEPCSGRRRECSQSLSKSQRSGCFCSAQDSASLTPQAYNLTGPFSPLPLCNISDTTNIHLHMVFPASPTWHSRHATLTAEPVHIHTHHHTTPVSCLMLPDLLSWKQMSVQAPAPLGSCLRGGAPIRMSSVILQLSEVNIPENTTVPV